MTKTMFNASFFSSSYFLSNFYLLAALCTYPVQSLSILIPFIPTSVTLGDTGTCPDQTLSDV